MKLTALCLLATTLLTVGCASKVVTYDSQGQVIGSCHSSYGFILAGGASCTGTANQEGRK